MISDLVKTRASRVMGIDCSTNSIAFCIYYNRKPIKWGKININGSDIYEKIGDANKKAYALYKELNIDYVVIESAVFVKSPKVALDLAYCFGAVISVLVAMGVKVIKVPPLVWQNDIGNPPLTKQEKEQLRIDFPGKSNSWYQNKGRKIRKQRTMDFFNKRFDMNLTDDDCGDACGLSRYGYYELTARK